MKMKKLISLIASLAIILTLVPQVMVSAAETTFYLANFAEGKYNGGDTYDLVDADDNVGLTVTLLGGEGVAASKDSGATVDGVAYGKPGLSPVTRPSESGGNWTSGMAFEFTPGYNGTIRVVYKLGNGKTMSLNNVTDSSKNTTHKNETGANENYVDFVVLANNTYRVYVTGTGNEYWGFAFTANTSSDPSISMADETATINVGDTYSLTAITSNTGDATVVWSSDNEAVATVADGVVSGLTAGTANITATVTVGGVDYSATCAVTVQDVATVTFDASAYACEGTAPAAVTVTKGEAITIPVNRSLYFDGMTLVGWSDSVNTYAIGDSVTLTEDITLTPVFEKNTVALGDAESTMVIDLGNKHDGQKLSIQYREDFIVYQTTINGTALDVKVAVDTTNGKINNDGRNDQWAQVNGGTVFTIPVLAGSVVSVDDLYYDDSTYTINGVDKLGDNGSETIAEAGNIDVVSISGGYWGTITVTYPKVEAVVTPEPSVEPAPAIEWTTTGTTTVTEGDGVYTVIQPANEAAAPVSTDLLKIMADAPADLTTADGVITVSYDLYRPSEMKGSSNWFFDISTNTNVPGWTGGNAGTFGRLSGYGPWGNNFKLIPGTGATNGTAYQFNNAKDDEWTTVVFTIDLAAKTVKAAMGEDSSEAMADAYPTGIENALYLNVEPCDSATGNDVVFQIKNITATYTAPDPNATPTPTPEPTPIPVPPVIPEGVTLHKYPANDEYVTGGRNNDNNYKLSFVEGADETIKAYFADPTNGAAVDTELVKNYKNYIGGTGTDTHPSIKVTLPAGEHSIYYLGYNHGNNVTATLNGTTYTAGAGANLMGDGGNILKVYEIKLDLAEAVTDVEVVFNSTDQWLPDLYAIVVAEVAAPAVEKTMPTVEVTEFGTYTADAGKPAKAFLGTFTVDPDTNNPVNCVKWTVGEATAVSGFGTTISSGTVVTGLVVLADDLAAIPAPTADALFAE